MNLHKHKQEFEDLITIVANYIGIPVDAVRRDYYIVLIMQIYKIANTLKNVYLKVEHPLANVILDLLIDSQKI